MEKLTVRKGRLSSRNRQILTKNEVLGEVLFPKNGKDAPATIVVRGERYDGHLKDLRLRKGNEEIMSAVQTKGLWLQLTVDYMGRQFVADYTSKGWFVRSGITKVGRFSYRELVFARGVPLLLQLYLFWLALEMQPEVDSRIRSVKCARWCGLYTLL